MGGGLRRPVTMQDVARHAGVSAATVSRVINERHDVNDATAERVREAIRELGYEGSLVARSLRSRRTKVLGLVTLTNFQTFTVEVLRGVTEAVRGSGYELIACVNSEPFGQPSLDWEQRQVSSLSGTLTDGCIVVTPWAEVRASTPVVAIDPIQGSSMHAVIGENQKGAVAALEHLLSLGHRRIAFVGGRKDLASTCAREAGYRQALADAGIDVDPALVVYGDYHREATIAPARSLLELPDRPTAVFASSDEMASTVIEQATALGYGVPGDLSVVGFDNNMESALAEPPLTTVDQNPQQMGYLGARLLMELIDAPAEDTRWVSVPTGLVVRDSTAPPPQAAV